MPVIETRPAHEVCAQSLASQFIAVVGGKRCEVHAGVHAGAVQCGAKVGEGFISRKQVVPQEFAHEAMVAREIVASSDDDSEAEVYSLCGGVQGNDNRRS